MTKKDFCPICGDITDVTTITRTEVAHMHGTEVPHHATFYKCEACHEEFDTPESMDANLKSVREAFELLSRTPDASEIEAIRLKYGASKKAYSLLLGFGETTVINYEKGQIPDSTHRLLLRIAAIPQVFRAIYDENKHKIGLTQRRRIESSLGYQLGEVYNGSFVDLWKDFRNLSDSVKLSGQFNAEPEYEQRSKPDELNTDTAQNDIWGDVA